MTKFKPYREESKLNYGRNVDEASGLSDEQIQLGAILRIADATEAMAKNHVQLVADLDYYKKRSKERAEEIMHLRARIAGLKGAVGRLQRKAAGR